MKRPDVLNFEYGKNIYDNGFDNDIFDYWGVFALAQYLHWELGYGKRRMEKYILSFCKENDKNFNEIININIIKSAIRNSFKKMPDKNEAVVITQPEIAKIKTIKNFKYQKLLFAMLVQAKRNKYDNTYVNKKPSFIGYRTLDIDTYKICRKIGIRASSENINYILNEFIKDELLDCTFGESSKILFSDDSGKPLIRVGGDEDPIEKYLEFSGGEIIYCSSCGKEEKKKSNRHELCSSCFKEKNLQHKRNWRKNVNYNNYRKKYKKQKVREN